MKSNNEPTPKSETPSQPKLLDSPAFRKRLVDQVREMAEAGQIKLAKGNRFLDPKKLPTKK